MTPQMPTLSLTPPLPTSEPPLAPEPPMQRPNSAPPEQREIEPVEEYLPQDGPDLPDGLLIREANRSDFRFFSFIRFY
jgi:hypothetical protein